MCFMAIEMAVSRNTVHHLFTGSGLLESVSFVTQDSIFKKLALRVQANTSLVNDVVKFEISDISLGRTDTFCSDTPKGCIMTSKAFRKSILERRRS